MTGHKLLAAALDHITRNPHEWDQHTWWCGTAGCLIGWAAQLDPHTDIVTADSDIHLVRHNRNGQTTTEHIFDWACDRFGLEPDQAETLTDHANTLDDLTEAVNAIHAWRPYDNVEELRDAVEEKTGTPA